MAKVSHEQLHRARGAIVGAAVGGAMARTAREGGWPDPVLGGVGELGAPWGSRVESMIEVAGDAVRGGALEFDAGPADVIGPAVADAVAGRGAPLLVDPDAVAVHERVVAAVSGRLAGGPAARRPGGPVGDGVVAEALWCVAADRFDEALRASWELGGDASLRMTLTGAFVGARMGVTAVPSRWLTYVYGPGGRRTHRQRDLLRLADRLVGFEAKMAPDPRRRIGPVEVFDGIWAANAFRVPAFCERHPDGAVISMCPMGDALDHHPVRRTFLIEDVAVRAANPRLDEVVEEVVATIAAFRGEGRQVLVHCHHGVSRTGLVLRAWLMGESSLSEPDATSEVEARWPWLSTANQRFTRLLSERGVT